MSNIIYAVEYGYKVRFTMNFIVSLLLISILITLFCTGLYALYYALIALTSRKRKRYVRSGRYNLANYYNNIVIIIYSHNNEKETAALLEALNRQNYPKNNYKTYIILDNCTDNSSNVLEMVGGANIFRVGDSYTVGKDESISQLLERLITFKNINAYVFLSANRSVDENFLNSINQGLMNHNVLVGNTVLKGTPDTLKDKILNSYNIYENNIINTSRSILGLTSLINSDCCVIKQNVIEKVQCIDFKDINTELKYSLMLAKLNYKISFDPNIVTYVDRADYSVRKASFSYRLTLFKNSVSVIPGSSFMFDEFVISIIHPSVVVLGSILIFLFWIAIMFEQYSKILNSLNVLIISGILLLSFVYSLLNSKLQFREIFYLLLYPLLSLGQLIRKLPVIKQICDFVHNKNYPKHMERHSFPVTVSAGNKRMNCSIELLEENGMIRAIFKFKNKKQATDLHLRVFDAIKSISNMLSEREYEIVDPNTREVVEKGNFDLRICQNCKYFTSKVDGTINIIKGSCSNNIDTASSGEKLVMLWNCCENYAPAKEKIVNLKQYKNIN